MGKKSQARRLARGDRDRRYVRFGHEPLSDRTKSVFKTYADDALEAGRYDFYMGHKLSGYLDESGFTDLNAFTLTDLEFSFAGAARPDMLDGWRARFERIKLLQEFWGVCGGLKVSNPHSRHSPARF